MLLVKFIYAIKLMCDLQQSWIYSVSAQLVCKITYDINTDFIMQPCRGNKNNEEEKSQFKQGEKSEVKN